MSKTASWVLVFAVGGCDNFSRDGEYWRITGFEGKSWAPLGLPRVLRLEERERVAFGLRWDISALLCVWPLGWGGRCMEQGPEPQSCPQKVFLGSTWVPRDSLAVTSKLGRDTHIGSRASEASGIIKGRERAQASALHSVSL